MGPGTVLAFALGLYLWMFVEVILHEGSHLIAARTVGFRPLAVTIGKGPLLFQGHVRGLAVRIHWLPLFGLVQATIPIVGLAWRGAVFAIAGLLTDAAMLVVFLNLAGFKTGAPDVGQSSPLTFFFAILAVYQFIIIVANLIPAELAGPQGRTFSNDGKQFVGYLSGRTPKALEAYERNIARYDPSFRIGDSWLLRGESSMNRVLVSAEADMAAGRHADATRQYLDILRDVLMPSAERAFLLDRIACISIIQGDLAFLPAAETFAREACTLLPECKTVHGTLGSIMVENGAYAEGLAILTPLTSEDNAPVDRGLASCFAAKALHRLGRFAEASECMGIARGYSEFSSICDRVERELAPAA